MTRNDQPGFVAVVPAGGMGSRMGAGAPKQYRVLGDKPVIGHTITALLTPDWIRTVHIVVAPGDATWQHDKTLADLTRLNAGRVRWHDVGGATRQETVLGGLAKIDDADNPWVMVHDAARPGISENDLNALRTAILANPAGALLATRVADTVKVESAQNPGVVGSTMPRDGLWLAQTPQVFPLVELRQVLQQAQASGTSYTDEASAMEAAGSSPALVPGSWRNFKLTTSEDFDLARIMIVNSNPPGSDD